MDYFDFVDGVFSDQPTVLALRFSLVERGPATPQETNLIWFARNDDTAVCAAGRLASPLLGHLSRVSQEIVDEYAVSGLRLFGAGTVAEEIRPFMSCCSEEAERLRSRFIRDGAYLVSADLEESGARPCEENDEDGEAAATLKVVVAGLPLDKHFRRSAWLLALCRNTADSLRQDVLFHYLACYYPIKFHRTPYHRWSRDFGGRYWIGLPRFRSSFLGSLSSDSARTGDPRHNIFWSKNRNSPLPAWRGVCANGIDELLAALRRRLADLDRRSGNRLGTEGLIAWLEGKGKDAGSSEPACAAVLCACASLAATDRLWLPLLCMLWRPPDQERTKDLDVTLTRLLGTEAKDAWRKYVDVAHAGYAIQAIIVLREALSRLSSGLVAESIHYQSAEDRIVHTVEISGIDTSIAETLAGEVVRIDEDDGGFPGVRPPLRGQAHSWVSSDLGGALRDMKDEKRGGIGEVTVTYVPERSALKAQILFHVGSVR